MIYRFRKVTNELFRGSAPSPNDVAKLKSNVGIKKIVSLDGPSAERIINICKALDIKHVIIPIEFPDVLESVLNFLKHDLKKLFLEAGPTYVHCAAGKDRTGLAVALVQCKYLEKFPEDAIEEAKSLGFGLGVDPKAISIFEKAIRLCKPSKDNNEANIVSNQRDYIGDNRDSFLDEGHQGSFAPFTTTRQYPIDNVYNFIIDQSPTRENYHSSRVIKEHSTEDNVVPMVGVFNNDAGGRGFGPTENAGGFIYD